MENSTLSLVQPLGTSPALFWPNFSSRKTGIVTLIDTVSCDLQQQMEFILSAVSFQEFC